MSKRLHCTIHCIQHRDCRPVCQQPEAVPVSSTAQTVWFARESDSFGLHFCRAPTQPSTLHVRNTHAYTQQSPCTVIPSSEMKHFTREELLLRCHVSITTRSVPASGLRLCPRPCPGTKTAVPCSHHKVSLNPYKTNLLAATGQFS